MARRQSFVFMVTCFFLFFVISKSSSAPNSFCNVCLLPGISKDVLVKIIDCDYIMEAPTRTIISTKIFSGL